MTTLSWKIFDQFFKIKMSEITLMYDIDMNNSLQWDIEMEESLRRMNLDEIDEISNQINQIDDEDKKISFLNMAFVLFEDNYRSHDFIANLLSKINNIDYSCLITNMPKQLVYKLYKNGKIGIDVIKKQAKTDDLISFIFSKELNLKPTLWFYTDKKELTDTEFEEIIEYGYPKGSYEYILKYDLINELIDQVAASTIDINKPCNVNAFDGVFATTRYSPLNFAALYGSVECFKYLIRNINEKPAGVDKCAVIGGNLEIIRIVCQENLLVSNCHEVAVKYNQNLIFDWLQENVRFDTNNYISRAANNPRALVYYVQNGYDIDAQIENASASHECAANNNLRFLKYLIENGADKNKKTTLGDSLLNVAQMFESQNVIKYLNQN